MVVNLRYRSQFSYNKSGTANAHNAADPGSVNKDNTCLCLALMLVRHRHKSWIT